MAHTPFLINMLTAFKNLGFIFIIQLTFYCISEGLVYSTVLDIKMLLSIFNEQGRVLIIRSSSKGQNSCRRNQIIDKFSCSYGRSLLLHDRSNDINKSCQ